MSIHIAGKLIKPTIFPDKTSQIWKLDEDQLNSAEIVWVYEGDHEIFWLMQCAELLHSQAEKQLTLRCDQFPYARQDKNIENNLTFAGNVLAYRLSDIFHTVVTFDMHNINMLTEWFEEVINTLPTQIITSIILSENIDQIVYPDLGASRRYSQLSEIPFVCVDKTRNQITGEITGVIMPILEPKKSVLIVDDLCDGGRTFIEVAKLIKQYGPKKIVLYISHGIFSQGVECLYDAGIDVIYTKDGVVTNAGYYNLVKSN